MRNTGFYLRKWRTNSEISAKMMYLNEEEQK